MEEKYKCIQCGQCCRQFQIAIDADHHKAGPIALFKRKFGFGLKSYDMTIIYHGECEHLLSNGKCAIYPKREGTICSNELKDYFCKKHQI